MEGERVGKIRPNSNKSSRCQILGNVEAPLQNEFRSDPGYMEQVIRELRSQNTTLKLANQNLLLENQELRLKIGESKSQSEVTLHHLTEKIDSERCQLEEIYKRQLDQLKAELANCLQDHEGISQQLKLANEENALLMQQYNKLWALYSE